MNIKSILFVIALCVGMQSWLVIGMEEEQQQSANQTSWWDYVPDVSGAIKRSASRTAEAAANVATAAKKKAYEAAMAVKSMPGATKEAMSRALERAKQVTGMTTMPQGEAEKRPEYQARPYFGWEESLTSPMVSSHRLQLSAFASLAPIAILSEATGLTAIDLFSSIPHDLKDPFIAGSLVLGALTYIGIGKIFDYFKVGKISEKDAVDRVQKCLTYYLEDKQAYPTLQSKIDALKNPESLLIFSENENLIIYQSCVRLIGKLEEQQDHEKKSQIDEQIDQRIKHYNQFLRDNTLEEKIRSMEQLKLSSDVIAYKAVEAQLQKEIGMQEQWAKNPVLAGQKAERQRNLEAAKVRNQAIKKR